MAYKETLSTLKFAERAKKIKNKAVVNEENNVNYYKKQILLLQKELEQLRGINNGSNPIQKFVPLS